MEPKLVRFIKFHGYLYFSCALVFTIRELSQLTQDALYARPHYWNFGQELLTRCHPTARWIFALLWLLALAVMYSGLRWEEQEYLQPVKALFLIEVVIVLVQDFVHTIKHEPNERLIRDVPYLFFFCAIVAYVLYTLETLAVLFSRPKARIVNSPSKVPILDCDSSMV
ncbi:uncharacterized protein LOC129724938 [Wyeomyia smithii]|uniref:uncharacterized protein LOC129724938 n=1 Tax=Wyeomyia smithii TaxID=174621 RepID=UPI002467D536|nr:uncharacterized protein LOC129724938 [Wyeomyia smithii]